MYMRSAAGAASESPSGVGAPEMARARDKTEMARIWRRDRMAQTLLELEEGIPDNCPQFMQKSRPQAMCIVWSSHSSEQHGDGVNDGANEC